MPDFSFEHAAGGIVAGIDEAGRGPWAGPVVAAAVILAPETNAGLLSRLDDSKALSEAVRETLFAEIQTTARVGVGRAEVDEIDRLNILQATMVAMARALDDLGVVPDHALVDGNRLPDLRCPATAIVKGDGRSLSIAAASIVAKVTRDREMAALARAFPGYGWERNKGYGTRAHQDALERLGVTPHHRKSFKPVHNMLSRDSGPTRHLDLSASL